MAGRNCAQVLADGRQCGAYATTGSTYCFTHDPDRVLQRSEARRAGGRAPRGRALASDSGEEQLAAVSVRSTQDVLLLVEATINDLRAGRVDPRVANGIGYLANLSVKVLEQTEIEHRLEALESVLDDDRRAAVARRRS